MSADNLVVYTGVRQSQNESNLEPLLQGNPKHTLIEQNDAPTNPLRRYIFTTDDFNISRNSNNEFSFSSFIRLHGEQIKTKKTYFTITDDNHGKIDIIPLGSGTNGTVFKLKFTKYDKLYVLKCMDDSKPIHKRQNRREIKILFYLKSVLDHNAWCVVNLYAAAIFMNTAFLLYEYIEGYDLFDIISVESQKPSYNKSGRRLGKLIEIPNSTILNKKRTVIFKNHTSDQYKLRIKQIADRLIEALAYIHSVGIIHNDIKPENIMVPNDPQILPFFIDFGFAAFIDEGSVYDYGTSRYLNIRRPTTTPPYNKTKEAPPKAIRNSTTNPDLYAIEKTFLFSGAIGTEVDEKGVNIDFEVYKHIYNYYLSNKHKENNMKERKTLDTIRAEAEAEAAVKKEAALKRQQAYNEIRKAEDERRQAEYARQQAEYARQREQYRYAEPSGKESGYSNFGHRGGRRKTKNKRRQKKTRKQTSN